MSAGATAAERACCGDIAPCSAEKPDAHAQLETRSSEIFLRDIVASDGGDTRMVGGGRPRQSSLTSFLVFGPTAFPA